jgi:hypothetical protein
MLPCNRTDKPIAQHIENRAHPDSGGAGNAVFTHAFLALEQGAYTEAQESHFGNRINLKLEILLSCVGVKDFQGGSLSLAPIAFNVLSMSTRCSFFFLFGPVLIKYMLGLNILTKTTLTAFPASAVSCVNVRLWAC